MTPVILRAYTFVIDKMTSGKKDNNWILEDDLLD